MNASHGAPRWPGRHVPDASYEAAPVRHTSAVALLAMVALVVALIVGVTVAVTIWRTPNAVNYVCPPDCGRPPIGQPVTVNPRFNAADGSFSVTYPGPETAYTASFDPDGVTLDLHVGDGGTLHLFGEPAAGRTPRDIAERLLVQSYPNAKVDYEVPNALVGYQPGYGVIADVYPASANSGEARLRVLIMVAVKNDLALVAAAAGPYHEFSPDFGSGHPSGANFFLALDIGKYVNSFMWRGDPVR
jgi:hypothetical protein